MRNLDKIGFVILTLVWPVSYYLKFIDPINNQTIVDYLITFCYCIGTSILSYYFGFSEQNKIAKYLFYYAISIFGILIISTYLIDLVVDSIFETKKVIISIISTICISLCIYLCYQKF